MKEQSDVDNIYWEQNYLKNPEIKRKPINSRWPPSRSVHETILRNISFRTFFNIFSVICFIYNFLKYPIRNPRALVLETQQATNFLKIDLSNAHHTHCSALHLWNEWKSHFAFHNIFPYIQYIPTWIFIIKKYGCFSTTIIILTTCQHQFYYSFCGKFWGIFFSLTQ